MAIEMKNWEVGSTWFSIAPGAGAAPVNQLYELFHTQSPVTFLSTCRSCIGMILDKIGRGGRAIVPGFTCHSVVEPFVLKGYSVYGYSLNENLTVNAEELISLIERVKPAVLLFHGYFGFNNLLELQQLKGLIESHNIIVIEDQTQNMYSTFARAYSDFQLGSIRKWMPIPDGAFVNNIVAVNLSEDSDLARAKTEAMEIKRAYIMEDGYDKQKVMESAIAAERLLDSRKIRHSASVASLDYLSKLDLENFKSIRCKNYSYLSCRLIAHNEIRVIHPDLNDGEVPFMLPVLIESRRAEFQKYMASHNVYPTIIWKCPDEIEGCIDDCTKMIYDRILCFHIDQRYSFEDMKKVGDLVDSYFTLN